MAKAKERSRKGPTPTAPGRLRGAADVAKAAPKRAVAVEEPRRVATPTAEAASARLAGDNNGAAPRAGMARTLQKTVGNSRASAMIEPAVAAPNVAGPVVVPSITTRPGVGVANRPEAPAREKSPSPARAAGAAPTPPASMKAPTTPGAGEPATAPVVEQATAPAAEGPTASAAQAAGTAAPPPFPAGGPQVAATKPPGKAADGAGQAGAAPSAAKGETPASGPAAAASAPKSPHDDPRFQAVAARVGDVAASQRATEPASAVADSAQAAAISPPDERLSLAADAQVGTMNQQPAKEFDRASFKAAVMVKIAGLTPKTLDEAEKFKGSGKAAEMRGDLSTQARAGRESAQGEIASATRAEPNPSAVEPRPAAPLVGPARGEAPNPSAIAADQAMPSSRPDAEVAAPFQEQSRALDDQMAAQGVTEEQLARSNEPTFQGALDSKKAAQQNAAEAPAAYRQAEAGTLGQAQAGAVAATTEQTQGMATQRGALLGQVAGMQTGTKATDEAKRAEVATTINGIFTKTRADVETRLAKIEGDVDTLFTQAEAAARQIFEDHSDARLKAYKEERYSGLDGKVRWVGDLFFPLPGEVNVFYEEAKAKYLDRMDKGLDEIAGTVEAGLADAKAIIARGKAEITKYVGGLDPSLHEIGQKAAAGIQGQFETLAQSIDEKQDQLIDQLANRYVEATKALDARIEEKKAENQGWISGAMAAMTGVFDTILAMKTMLLSVVAKAREAIGLIIADPIGFLGNLVAGVKLGFMNFVGKIGSYLKQGLLDWLFGAMAEAGIQMPATFDLKGIFSLVLQVLGLTYANIRARAVKIVGEPLVSKIELAAGIFKRIVTEGPIALWDEIKEKLGDLNALVIEPIKAFVIEKVITAGVTWVVSLLNPASAFVKACKAIYDIVMFFVERGKQVLVLVNAVLDSVLSIAKGAIGVAAAFVETALAKALPVVISFLASLLGLGGISTKIKAILGKIQAPVNAAIDWVIKKVVQVVKAAGIALGIKEKKEGEPNPDHDAKVEKGAAFLVEKSKAASKNGKLSPVRARLIAMQARLLHRVFKSISVAVEGGKVTYQYTASVGIVKTELEPAKIDENQEQVEETTDVKGGISVPKPGRPLVKTSMSTRVAGELDPADQRTPGEVKQTRNFFERNREKARAWWSKRTGTPWPDNSTHDEHPRPLKDGGDPLFIEPGFDGPHSPHMIPGPDGLTDFQRWGKLGGRPKK